MKILVTGATGCLGIAVANHLYSKGYAVTGTRRNLLLAKHLSPGVAFLPAELSDANAINRLVIEHDTIVHCAGLSTLWGPARDFEIANVEATKNLLASALKHKIKRFIFISTPSVYFDFTNRWSVKEGDYLPETPVNSYAKSKLICEKLVVEAESEGLPAVILRPRAIFGPNDRALLPRFLRLAKRGVLPLIDNGRAQIDLTYVENVAHAVCLTLDNIPRISGKTYNITNGEPITVNALFSKIITEFKLATRCFSIPYGTAYRAACLMETVAFFVPGRPEPPLTKYTVGILGRSQTLSIQAARQDLSYSPIVSLEQGIKKTAATMVKDNA